MQWFRVLDRTHLIYIVKKKQIFIMYILVTEMFVPNLLVQAVKTESKVAVQS